MHTHETHYTQLQKPTVTCKCMQTNSQKENKQQVYMHMCETAYTNRHIYIQIACICKQMHTYANKHTYKQARP